MVVLEREGLYAIILGFTVFLDDVLRHFHLLSDSAADLLIGYLAASTYDIVCLIIVIVIVELRFGNYAIIVHKVAQIQIFIIEG